MRSQLCLLPIRTLLFAASLILVLPCNSLFAQNEEFIPPPQSNSGGFFSRELGTALRFNYHTQGYGTEADVVSLGTMKVFNHDSGIIFVDGQATLSDDFGGGFNLGVGLRRMINSDSLLFSTDPQRVIGVGFWTDGQSTAADNFFTQLGFSFESLGDSFDIRVNGHFPLDTTQTSDPVLSASGTPFYSGNEIFTATETITTDTAYSVVDAEIAKRINDLEAWAYLGGYQLDAGSEDATGYRVGVRGYAVPDLALSLQVTDDDIYATNVVFGITWFVGRTNCNNEPCGNVYDRLREPVLRNDFIATTSTSSSQASGDALTAQGTTNDIHVVHVDSTAAAGGDGTFENPLDSLAAVEANSFSSGAGQEASIILVHGGSVLTETDTLTLQEGQRLLGEGTDADMNQINHFVDTNELGLITLPETAAGAQDQFRPTIDASGVPGDFITLADDNTVNNLDIANASATAITGNAINAPTLQNLEITTPTGNGISLTDITNTTVIENTVNITNAGGTALLIDGGQDGMSIAANIVNSAARSLEIVDRTGGTITYSGRIDDDGGTGILIDNNLDSTINLTNTDTVDGTGAAISNGIDINTGAGDAITITNNSASPTQVSTINFSGTVGATGTGTAQAINIAGNDADTAITFSDIDATAVNGDTVSVTGGGTVTMSSVTTIDPSRTIANTGTGSAFVNTGNAAAEDNATLVINSNINNSVGGNAVNLSARTANNATFNGTVTHTGTGDGIFLSNNVLGAGNPGGTIDFNGLVTSMTTGAGDAIELVTNTDTTIRFDGGVVLDAQGTGRGFTAMGGGILAVQDPADASVQNTIDTDDGIGLELVGMTIDASNVVFDVVNVSSGTAQGILLTDLDGTGQVSIGASGTAAPDGGTLTTAGTAVDISNAMNVNIANMRINNNVGTVRGVEITDQEATSIVSLSNMEVTTLNGNAFTIGDETAVGGSSNDNGTINLVNVTATTSGTGDGIFVDNNDTSTAVIGVTDATLNANGTGRGFFATGGGTITVAGTNTINSVGDTAFEANNVENLTASNVTIANTTAAGVLVTGQNTSTDAVTLTNFDVTTTTANAVEVSTNTEGTVNLNTLVAESTTGNTVFLDNNGNSNININGMEATATGSGDAFTATNGGVLTMTGTNNVTANDPDNPNLIDGDGGRGIFVRDVDDRRGKCEFWTSHRNEVSAGTTTGIEIANTTGTGQVSVMDGTMTTGGNAIQITNAEDVAIDSMQITNTGGNGVVASNSAGDLLTLTNLEVTTTTGMGVNVTGGDFNATGTNSIDTTSGQALNLANTTISGAANFQTVNVTGGTGVEISLNNVAGDTVTIGSGSNSGDGGTISTDTTGIFVSNVDSLSVNNLIVNKTTNAVGPAVTVTAQTAGSTATFNGLDVTTDDSSIAVQVQNNNDGTIAFNNLTTTSANGVGVLVNNNNSATVTLNNIDVDTTGTATAGVQIAGTGTTNITGTNTVDTAAGTTIGIDIDNAETVSIAGTTINADGDAIDIDHTTNTVSDVSINNVTIQNADIGIDIAMNSVNELDVTITNSNITGISSTGINLDTGASANRVDFTLTDTFVTVDDDSAFLATLNDSNTADVRFVLDGNTLTNNSATAAAAQIDIESSLTLSARIGNLIANVDDPPAPLGDSNRFVNTGAGDPFRVVLNDPGATAVLNLDLRDNTAQGGTVEYVLTQTSGNFNLVDATDTLGDVNNVGTVNDTGVINTIAPPVQAPTP